MFWLCACGTVFAPLCNTCTSGIHVRRPGWGQRSLLQLVCHWICMPVCLCVSEMVVCVCVCVCVSSWGPDWCVGAMLGDECASSQFISQSVGPLGDRRACSYSLASRKSVSCGNNLASNRVDPGSSWVIWEETRWCFGGGGGDNIRLSKRLLQIQKLITASPKYNPQIAWLRSAA